MKRLWKKIVSGILTAAMLLTLLPGAAYAALWENSADQNQKILDELTDFWGDEKTAQEAVAMLEKYGLLDEEGNVLSDWSDEIYLQTDPTPLTLAEARKQGGTVTVNGRSCKGSDLDATLTKMEVLGLLSDGLPVADWKLTVNGVAVAPTGLEAALSAAQTAEPETEPDAGTETEPVTETGLEAKAPAAAVLGREADGDALGEIVAFLDQYGLLTDTGAAEDWGLTLPGGKRKTNVTELLAMAEDGTAKDDMVISVDGSDITMADFSRIMQIQEELTRIQDTYFPEGGAEWTPEQQASLNSLYAQL